MKRLSLCTIALLATLPAFAQQQKPSKDVPRPPVLEKLEEGDPAVNIPKKGAVETEERREQGKVKEVTVKTPLTTYKVHSNDQPGSIQPGEGGAGNSRPATFNILEFDLGQKKKDSKEAAPVPAPPSPK